MTIVELHFLNLPLSMNYLAHAYLSFDQPKILAGNMFSDFVKGKKQYEYERLILKGIVLHRRIDQFTDEHPVTKEMKKFFKPDYGLYAGAFADIVYDYFLANDTIIFNSPEALQEFSKKTYRYLDENILVAPLIFQQMFPYMKSQDWLSNYRFEWGIQKSFTGMTRRAKYISESEPAFKIFENNISALKPFYDAFFPQLKNYTESTLQELLKTD